MYAAQCRDIIHISVRSKVPSELSLSHSSNGIIIMNAILRNHFIFLFDFSKMPTSSEPSAQSKSPSHQNLEETQSPLAQRKSFSVQVCGSGDRKIAQGYSITCNFILKCIWHTTWGSMKKEEVSQAESINCLLKKREKYFMKHLWYIIKWFFKFIFKVRNRKWH